MKINWKLRLKNKTTLAALLTCICTFSYQILGIIGVSSPISEDTVMQFVGVALNLFVTLGVIIDPTTKGISDSDRALNYSEHKA